MGSRARLRFAVLAPLAAVTACGLLASPGDYSSGGVAEGTDGSADATSGDRTTGDVIVLPDGNVVPASRGTIVIAAGEREPTSPEDDPAWTADVITGVLDENGNVARWRIEKSAPIVGSFDATTVLDGKWVMLNFGFGVAGARGHAIQSIGWAPGPSGDWRANRATMPGGLDDVTRTFFGGNIVTVGGTRTVPVDGGTSTSFVRELHIAAVDPSQNEIGSFLDGPQLATARARPGLLFSPANSLYVVGGRVSSGLTASVEAAKGDVASATFENFAAQPPLVAGGADHRVFQPSLAVANGWLYCAGGRINTTSAPTDVVLAAKIDSATGNLAAWKEVTKLPVALRDFAFVSHDGMLYVIGGVLAAPGARSNEVYGARVGADGSLGAWASGDNAKLPAKRSDIVAVAFK